MKIEDVKKLPPLERFLYWIRERHQIYLRRQVGKEKPWTDDEVLQRNFFTNPYRENDKVTVWFRENIREPLRDDPRVLMATIIFRWFNLPETGELLWKYGDGVDGCMDLLTGWNKKLVLSLLRPLRDKGQKIFTGAFMINSPAGKPKLEAICDRIDTVWKDRDGILNAFLLPKCFGKDRSLSLKDAHEILTRYEGLGGFMAYEIVCDLRYTYLLENAPDKLTWCNPGPGAIRGVYRILERDFPKGNNASSPPLPKDWTEQTQKLLKTVQSRLSKMPPFELREVEHSLCEFDKYERLLWGDGRAKRTYPGV